MTRESMNEAVAFATIVTGAFFVRNALIIGGLASFLAFGLISG